MRSSEKPSTCGDPSPAERANESKQRVYFRQAGARAAATYNNQVALAYYQRLLPLLPSAQRSDVLRDSGEILRLTGDWDAAEEAARAALAAASAARTSADAQRLLGTILSRKRSYAAALPLLEQALATFTRLDDQVGQSRTLELLSFAAYQQGDNEQALTHAQAQLQIAIARGDRQSQADAIGQIAYVDTRRGDFAAALTANEECLVLAQAAGHRRREAQAHSEIARIYWQRGDYVAALGQLLNGLTVADEIGYRQMIGMLIGNAGLIYEYLGDYPQAQACYSQALAVAAELGDEPGILALSRVEF